MRPWFGVLAALVGVRLAIPLVVLAAEGHDLRALPPYDYEPLNGDAFGFYAEARELISAAAGPHGLAAALLLAAGVWAAWRPRGWLRIAVAALAISAAASALVVGTEPAGSAVVGWSLVWAVPLLPLRVAGALDADAAFAVGFPLSLAANAVTVVAVAYAGLYASGRRSVGLAAAALFAAWPFLSRALAGESAWENGQWNVDVGLHLYTEPLSTALVAVAFALILSPRFTDVRLAFAGAALGFATVVKVSNALLAVLALAVVAWRDRRGALPLAAAGLAFAPLVAAYWPKGYPEIPNKPRWGAEFFADSWTDSLVFDLRTLIVLAPLALLGAWALRRRSDALALLAGSIVTTALLYSFYEATREHPRFLYAALPPLFVLEAAGASLLLSRGSARP